MKKIAGILCLISCLSFITCDQFSTLLDEPKSIEIRSLEYTLSIPYTTNLSVIAIMPNNEEKDITSEVIWQSLDSGIASIDNDGLLEAISEGTTTIRAQYLAYNLEITKEFTITSAVLDSIDVTPKNNTIYWEHPTKGNTKQFTAIGTFSDSSTQDITSSVTWSSNVTGAATINSTGGLATAQSAGGITTITAQSGTVSSTTQLYVKTKIYRINENFDGVWPPEDWTGDFGTDYWSRLGSYHIGVEAASFSSLTPQDTEGRLYTPTFDLTSLEDCRVEFWYMSKLNLFWWNVMEIYKSDDNSNWTKLERIHDQNTWVLYSYSLESTIKYIHFKGESGNPGYREYDTHIDNVVVYGWALP